MAALDPSVEFKSYEEAFSTGGVPEVVTLFNRYVEDSLNGKGIVPIGLKVSFSARRQLS